MSQSVVSVRREMDENENEGQFIYGGCGYEYTSSLGILGVLTLLNVHVALSLQPLYFLLPVLCYHPARSLQGQSSSF